MFTIDTANAPNKSYADFAPENATVINAFLDAGSDDTLGSVKALRSTLAFRMNVCLAEGGKIMINHEQIRTCLAPMQPEDAVDMNGLLAMIAYFDLRSEYVYIVPQHYEGRSVKAIERIQRGFSARSKKIIKPIVEIDTAGLEINPRLQQRIQELKTFVLHDLDNPSTDDQIYEAKAVEARTVLRSMLYQLIGEGKDECSMVDDAFGCHLSNGELQEVFTWYASQAANDVIENDDAPHIGTLLVLLAVATYREVLEEARVLWRLKEQEALIA